MTKDHTKYTMDCDLPNYLIEMELDWSHLKKVSTSQVVKTDPKRCLGLKVHNVCKNES